MKRNVCLVMILITVLAIVIGFSGCDIDINTHHDECDVRVKNNSGRTYTGKVWTNDEKLYDGRLKPWESRTFYVKEDSRVYTFFESDCGRFSSPSGKAKTHKTLVLEL